MSQGRFFRLYHTRMPAVFYLVLLPLDGGTSPALARIAVSGEQPSNWGKAPEIVIRNGARQLMHRFGQSQPQPIPLYEAYQNGCLTDFCKERMADARLSGDLVSDRCLAHASRGAGYAFSRMLDSPAETKITSFAGEPALLVTWQSHAKVTAGPKHRRRDRDLWIQVGAPGA
ncbi:hypothetical protein CKO28_01230 [Rhodovibrio sodomensis]|uniref:Uncharacterized protein n=1 Tax=Rhodovibrio sodomensis TaxID=1088 RepID=A0ABS1D9U2_9PROT|nr:hypothetical protein [Rhodovibrio sodomensis]MBK1666666.1 hypothetical protein [Rhodovibrio sodomensis]